MSEHSWTPGPWFVHDFADPAVSSAPGPNDVTVSCSTPDTITVAFMGNALTAELDEARANARLIAAAPALYEALEEARPVVLNAVHSATSGPWQKETREGILNRMDAALAKARGEP